MEGATSSLVRRLDTIEEKSEAPPLPPRFKIVGYDKERGEPIYHRLIGIIKSTGEPTYGPMETGYVPAPHSSASPEPGSSVYPVLGAFPKGVSTGF